MSKRTMSENEAKAILNGIAGISFKGKIIVIDKASFKGMGLGKCAAFDCLKNHYGYR